MARRNIRSRRLEANERSQYSLRPGHATKSAAAGIQPYSLKATPLREITILISFPSESNSNRIEWLNQPFVTTFQSPRKPEGDELFIVETSGAESAKEWPKTLRGDVPMRGGQ